MEKLVKRVLKMCVGKVLNFSKKADGFVLQDFQRCKVCGSLKFISIFKKDIKFSKSTEANNYLHVIEVYLLLSSNGEDLKIEIFSLAVNSL